MFLSCPQFLSITLVHLYILSMLPWLDFFLWLLQFNYPFRPSMKVNIYYKSLLFSALIFKDCHLLFSTLLFEKGYCEYRLNRTSEAYRTLTSVPNPDHRIKELLAQVVCSIFFFLILRFNWKISKILSWHFNGDCDF